MRTTTHRKPLALLAGATLLVSCGDAPSEPEALLVARETQAALQVSEALPTLPRMVARVREQGDGHLGGPEERAFDRAVGLWLDARASVDAEAVAVSEDAYRVAAPELAAALSPEALGGAVRDLEEWIYLARPLVGMDQRLGLRAALDEGTALTRQAVDLAAAGDTVRAVHALLRAADRLDETTPWTVSARLIGSVDAQLADMGITQIDRNPSPSDERGVTLARAQRLLEGAREARAAGDATLALQRAFYAGRLLDTLR